MTLSGSINCLNTDDLLYGTQFNSTCGSYWAPRLPSLTPEERKQQWKERIARIKKQEKEIREKWRRWTMADLNDEKKEKILNIINSVFAGQRGERGWKDMTNGVKWLLIFIGLSLLFNSTRIIHLIELSITK